MQNVIWFRNDLRTIDNPALSAALTSKPQRAVRAVFCITEAQWLDHAWGANKIAFVLQSLLELHKDLHDLNISLDILECGDFASVPKLLSEYLIANQAQNLFYNLEYELNERKRDRAVELALNKSNITIRTFNSQCLIAPGALHTKQGTPYTVFTPFKKASYVYLYEQPLKLLSNPKAQAKTDFKRTTINLPSKMQSYLQNKILKLWPAGQAAAQNRLHDFCASLLPYYKEQRDFPAIAGTSTLSPYLAVGALSVRQCFLAAMRENKDQFAGGNENIACWISELIWRDFYKHIIFHYPDLCKGKNFNSKYDQLAWQNPGDNLLAWQNGMTGVPIVDAAMRQLVQTGWMHNRLRMIVAMFLTKNLLIDWRHGEKFFSQHLIDLDYSANNGGWQWSASTGTDAVPYFRIFNPITQSQKFDPQGDFIQQYCPELKSLNSKQIHDPSVCLTTEQLKKLNYRPIMVDLAKSRARAIEYFKRANQLK